IEKLQLDGQFREPTVHLADAAAQEKLDQLSARAKGQPQRAQEPNLRDVISQLSGGFRLRAATLSLQNLKFQLPGASIALAGDYHLAQRDFDFHGMANFEARLSQMTSGWKSILLKGVDPFFARNGSGTSLPIRISGTGTSPSFHLDLFHRGD